MNCLLLPLIIAAVDVTNQGAQVKVNRDHRDKWTSARPLQYKTKWRLQALSVARLFLFFR